MNLFTVLFLALCDYFWDPSGTNFVIFQCCHRYFQCAEADTQLCTQFPYSNPPCRWADCVLIISWCDSCMWLSGTWIVFHITVTTAEMHHPLPHCADIHCLVSIKIQKVSMTILFFCMEKFNSTPLPHMHSMSDAILSDCPSAAICHMARKCNGILAGRFNPYCHTTNIHLWYHGPT